MMRKMLAASLFLAILGGTGVRAQEAPSGDAPPLPEVAKKYISVDLTYASQYMTNGFNVGGDHPALQPNIDVVLPISGFSLGFWGNFPTDVRRDQFDELDFLLRYNQTFFSEKKWALNLHGYIDYWSYPAVAMYSNFHGEPISKTFKDGLKYNLGVAMPNLCKVFDKPLVPFYNAYMWMPIEKDLFDPGMVHEWGVSYDLPVPALLLIQKDQAYTLTTTLNYNDGAFGVDPDWSHATVGLSTSLSWGACYLSPSINYQRSMESSVDTEDEVWFTLTVGTKF